MSANKRGFLVFLVVLLAVWLGSRLIVFPESVPDRPPGDYTPVVDRSVMRMNTNQSYEERMEEGWQARDDLPHWEIDLPLEWEADPFDDTNWRAQLHFWKPIYPHYNEYFRTEDPSILENAVPFMLDWWRAAQEESIGRFGWYDMSTGLRAFGIALVLDKIYAGELEVENDELEKLNAMADEHARWLQKRDFISTSNHGMFQVYGLRLLCDVIAYRPVCDGAQEFAAEMFGVLLEHQYTEEGVHKEHSPDYHSFFINRVQRFGGTEVFESGDQSLFDRLERARQVRYWLTYPNRKIIPLGDSVGGGPLADRLEGPVQCEEESRCYVLGDFSDSGYVSVRSGPEKPPADDASMLLMTGMSYSPSHKHVDDLSFVLYEDRVIFTDGGKYGYNWDDYRQYVRSAAAHNTVGLADRRIGHREVEHYGSALNAPEMSNGEYLFSGQIEDHVGLFDFERELRYRPREYVKIVDVVSAEESLPFASRLLLAHDLQVRDAGGRELGVFDDESEIAVITLETEDCELSTVRGQEEPRVLGWEAVDYQEMVPATMVQAVCAGREREIRWSIDLAPNN